MSTLTCATCKQPVSTAQLMEGIAIHQHLEEYFEKTKNELTWALEAIEKLHKQLAIAHGTFDPQHDYSARYPGDGIRGVSTDLPEQTSKENGQDQNPTSAECHSSRRETFEVRGKPARPDNGVGLPFFDETVPGWKFMDSDGWVSPVYAAQSNAEHARARYILKYNRET